MAKAKSSARRGTSQRIARVSKRREPQSAGSSDLIDAVITSASKLIADEGWDNVSTNRIAKTAGVSVGFLYRYFPNREAIARAVVHRLWDEELAALQGAFRDGTPTIEKMAMAYFDHVAQNPRLHAESSAFLVHLVAEDARAWDEKVISAIAMGFDAELEDDPAKRMVCENIYVAAIHIARRAALLNPAGLADRSVQREFAELVRGYLARFRRRPNAPLTADS